MLSLSIVSHGDVDKVANLLESIRQHEINIKVGFQVILTDNLGDQIPEFDSAPWASLRIIRNERVLGFAENHNRAFEHATGEYFAILNPDLIFEKSIFDALLHELQTYKADLIAPQIVDEVGAIQDSFRPLPTPFEMIRRRLPGYKFKPYEPDGNGIIHPDWIAGMFWLMPSDTYRKLGGMDKRFRLYLEDVDFCSRARLSGMKIMVAANIQVRHDAQRTSRRNLYYLYLHFRSAIRFFMSPVYRQVRQL